MQVNATSMMAHTNWLASNSNNIANINTDDYKATDTTLTSSSQNSVDATFSKSNSNTQLEKELTEQIPIERGFEANVKAVQTEEQMIGSLIDLSI
jgi:flagellar hook protein FlgE